MVKYTDKQIKIIIDNMVILQDTREKTTFITDTYDNFGVKWESVKLNSGDFSAYIPPIEKLGFEGLDFRDELVIERKMSNDEISRNLSANKERFHREFQRSKGKIIILIEDSYKNIMMNNYKSKLMPKQFLGLLHTLSFKYDAPFVFIDKESTPLYIYNTFKYYTRYKLKSLKTD